MSVKILKIPVICRGSSHPDVMSLANIDMHIHVFMHCAVDEFETTARHSYCELLIQARSHRTVQSMVSRQTMNILQS